MEIEKKLNDAELAAELLKLEQLLKDHKVEEFDPFTPIQDDPIIKKDDAMLASVGNILGIIGPPKAGKSAASSALIAGCINEIVSQDSSRFPDTLGFDIQPNHSKKAVVYIDTEQAKGNYNSFIKNTLKRAGLSEINKPDFFYAYNLKKNDIENRKIFLKNLLSIISNIHNGIHLIVIDGIADFVYSINEERDCNLIIDSFIKMAEQHKTVIALVIHQNPGKDKTRGHLGSQLERKAESIIKITKKKGFSEVTPLHLRNAGGFDPIKFSFNSELGYHTLFYGVDEDNEEKSSIDFLSKIFSGNAVLKRQEIIRKIMDEFGIKDKAAYRRLSEKYKDFLAFDKSTKTYSFFPLLF
jgi:archaellum biogenesis ATPase FlaH